MSWSIIAASSPSWAKKVFPDLTEKEAVDALWNAIFQAARIDEGDPVDIWKKHNASLHQKVEYLNQKRFKKLHYSAPGTELTVELPDRHLWKGGASANKQGFLFNANMPTEEVYTSLLKTGTNGVGVREPIFRNGNWVF